MLVYPPSSSRTILPIARRRNFPVRRLRRPFFQYYSIVSRVRIARKPSFHTFLHEFRIFLLTRQTATHPVPPCGTLFAQAILSRRPVAPIGVLCNTSTSTSTCLRSENTISRLTSPAQPPGSLRLRLLELLFPALARNDANDQHGRELQNTAEHIEHAGFFRRQRQLERQAQRPHGGRKRAERPRVVSPDQKRRAEARKAPCTASLLLRFRPLELLFPALARNDTIGQTFQGSQSALHSFPIHSVFGFSSFFFQRSRVTMPTTSMAVSCKTPPNT